jgi:putative peptidoglycan lipid II flippase
VRGLLRHLRPWAPPTRLASDQGIANQAALSSGGVLVQGVVRFLYSVVIGNTLGRAVLGVVNASIAVALLASLLVPSATAMAATKYVARARGAGDLDEVERVVRHLSRVTLGAVLVLGVVAAALAVPLFRVTVTEAVLTGALAVAYSLYVYVRGFLFGAGQVVRATVWDTVSACAALVGLALVLVAGADAWLLLPLTVCYGGYAAASWPRGRGALAPDARREVRGFLWLSLVNSVATGGFLQLTMVAAGYWDRVDAGSFAAALSLATPASLMSRSLTLVLFPSLAAAHGRGDTEGAHRQTDVATRGLVVLSLASFGPLMLVSPALIDLLYRRPDFESAKTLLPLLLAAVMATNLAAGAINSLLSREHRYSRLVVAASVVGALVGLVWWVWRVPSGGVREVALGFLVGSAVVGFTPVVAVWRIDRHRWAGLSARFLVGVAVVALACWWEARDHLDVVAQVAMAVGFAALWVGLNVPDLRPLVAAARRR